MADVRYGRGSASSVYSITRVGSLPELIRTLPQRQLIYFWFANSSSVECVPGELFALLTDGLIEVFDDKRNDLGLTGRRAC
jgi:hypothetical protein